MRDILSELAAGELSVDEAEAKLSGYITTEAGRFDAARETRRGVPEAILAEGKSTADVITLVQSALESSDRVIVTRVSDADLEAIERELEVETVIDAKARTLVAHTTEYERPSLDARIAIVTAGTSDAPAAGEAATIATEMGATVDRIDDVGVAGIHRLFDHLDELRSVDVLIVAAGREGALPTVVAGLVNTPVIGLPTSIGYGHAGAGEAALAGMLQSCSVVTVVNIDAGFVAGAQAGLIAQSIAEARSD